MRLATLTIVLLATSASAGFVNTYPEEAYASHTVDADDAATSQVQVRRHFTVNATVEAYVWMDPWTVEAVEKGFTAAYRLGPTKPDGQLDTVFLEESDVRNTDTSDTVTLGPEVVYVLELTLRLPEPGQREAGQYRAVGVVALREAQGTQGSGGVLDPSIGTRIDVTIIGPAAPSPSPSPSPSQAPPTSTCGPGQPFPCSRPPSSPCTESGDDTDGDGLPDEWERDNFRSLGETPHGDRDGDGYSNCSEHLAGSDPTDPRYTPGDLDGDGMADTCEARHFGGPNARPNEDPDGDTFSNLVECREGSNPTEARSVPFHVAVDDDTDGDGLGDWWERHYFRDLSQDALADPDGDRCNNLCEHAKGSDPTQAEVPRPSPPPLEHTDWQPWLYAAGAAAGLLLLVLVRRRREERVQRHEYPAPRKSGPRDDGPFLLRSDPFGPRDTERL